MEALSSSAGTICGTALYLRRLDQSEHLSMYCVRIDAVSAQQYSATSSGSRVCAPTAENAPQRAVFDNAVARPLDKPRLCFAAEALAPPEQPVVLESLPWWVALR